jgi:phage terminase large subunit-like protein
MANKRAPRPVTTTSRDPVTTYARKVQAGKIVAGPFVRAACDRHLRDLETAADRGLRFDPKLAARAIGFFESELRLSKGKHEGQPFILLDWQAFVVGSIFGWVWIGTGKRRYSKAFVETGKGAGKSPLLAGIGIYLLIADGEAGSEIYFAATTKEQAKVAFGAASAFHRHRPNIGGCTLVPHMQNRDVVRFTLHPAPGKRSYGFMGIISSDENQSGPIPHGIMVDELHEWANAGLLNVLEAGTKGREQALIVMITNSGKRRAGVCWDNHEYARRVALGEVEDDTLFSYVCAVDFAPDGKTELDPFNHPEEWVKVNPSLGQTIERKYLEDQVRKAKNLPSMEPDVRRLNFCQWGAGENSNPWISYDLWNRAGREYTLSDLKGRRAYIGKDLSGGSIQVEQTYYSDLTSAVFLVEPELPGEPWYLLPYFWLPREGLAARGEKENTPWMRWADEGHLLTCPGKTIDYAQVAATMIEVARNFEIIGAGRDPAMTGAFDRECMAADITIPWQWTPVRQGYLTMGPAIKEMERRLTATQTGQNEDEQGRVIGMVHCKHPILTYCVANASIATDPAGNKKFIKNIGAHRIDGIVAAANATALTLAVDVGNTVTPDDFVFL